MDLNPIVLSIPVYFILIGVELLVQHFQKENHYRLNDALTNISCGITDQVAHVFMKIFTITIYQLVFQYFSFFTIPSNWLTLAVLFVACDFCYYWAHRKSHEIHLFWIGHVVHHQSEEYNLSVALRQGALQVVFTFFFYLPLAFLGFDTLSFVLMNGLVTVYQFWIHTESIGRLGWFEKVFNTPSHHRVHHGRDPKYIDKNHAGVFILWDKMFGTFQEEEERPTYGVTVPVNTWNPLMAHISPVKTLFRSVRKAQGLDKLRVLLKPPGWMPEYAGGFQKPKAVDKSVYRKFDIEVNRPLGIYVLVQYLFVIGGTAMFLFNHEKMNLTHEVLGAVAIMHAVINFGAMFENRKWSFFSEMLRLVSLPFIVFAFISPSSFQNELFITVAAVSMISLAFLSRVRKTAVQNSSK